MFKSGDIIVLETHKYFANRYTKEMFPINIMVEVLDFNSKGLAIKFEWEDGTWFSDSRDYRLATGRERFLYYTHGQKALIDQEGSAPGANGI